MTLKEAWIDFKKQCGEIRKSRSSRRCNLKTIFFISLLFLILTSVFLAGYYDDINILTKDSDGADLTHMLYFISGIATTAIALIAYINLTSIKDINKNAHLLQIDKRWGDPQIIKARQIIHIIYREIRDNKNTENLSLDDVYTKMGQIILMMSKDNRNHNIGLAFIYLLNYLDLMESLSFIYKDSSSDQIQELESLCGETLEFNYRIYYMYIYFIRVIRKNPKFYNNFAELMASVLKQEDRKVEEIHKVNKELAKDLCKHHNTQVSKISFGQLLEGDEVHGALYSEIKSKIEKMRL